MPSPLDLVLPIRVQRIEKLAVPPDGTAAPSPSHGAGFDAGYEQGRLRAQWEADRDGEKQTARVRALIEKLDTLHADFGRLLEEHLPDLIQGALARVFRQHPFTAAEIGAEIGALLREMEQAGRLTLECEPAAEASLRRELEACDAVPTGLRWTLQGNPALNPGEFLLRSDLGDVDGRHSTRLRQLHHALEGRS